MNIVLKNNINHIISSP